MWYSFPFLHNVVITSCPALFSIATLGPPWPIVLIFPALRTLDSMSSSSTGSSKRQKCSQNRENKHLSMKDAPIWTIHHLFDRQLAAFQSRHANSMMGVNLYVTKLLAFTYVGLVYKQ